MVHDPMRWGPAAPVFAETIQPSPARPRRRAPVGLGPRHVDRTAAATEESVRVRKLAKHRRWAAEMREAGWTVQEPGPK